MRTKLMSVATANQGFQSPDGPKRRKPTPVAYATKIFVAAVVAVSVYGFTSIPENVPDDQFVRAHQAYVERMSNLYWAAFGLYFLLMLPIALHSIVQCYRMKR